MNVRIVGVLAVAALPLVAWPSAAPRYMSVDEVRPGMTGVGRTVFEGDKVEEFTVHILGVLRNINGPRRDMVLARLEGGPLAETGVIAGMSGSPVYIDGRLLGAVAFSLGQFPKEPLAGITPIEEMIQAAGPQPRRAPPEAVTQLAPPLTQDRVLASLRGAFSRFVRPFADSPADVRFDGLDSVGSARASELGVLMRPIATPLALGGFSGAVGDRLTGVLRDAGFTPVPDSASPSFRQAAAERAPVEPRLRPGDAVGVNVITGDFLIGATGTVTEVDGNQVYAFGHPLYNLGTTEFPMTRAYVYALLPSLLSSMKIAMTGETIGTFKQDRATAVAGTLGRGPDMVPVHLSLDTERGLSKSFTFQVVADQLFTPLLTYVSIVNSLSSYEKDFGAATFTVTGTTKIRGHGEVALDDVFTGDSPSIGAAAYAVAPLTLLLANDVEPVRIDAVDLHIVSSEHQQTATLERIWVDATTIRPGTTVPLKMLLHTYRGEDIMKTVPIDIPAGASGQLSISVSDGARLAQSEARDFKSGQVRTLDQLIRIINKGRKNNRLYVRLLRQDAGAVVNGESLPALPPSVQAVMDSDRNGGGVTPLRNAASGEREVAIGCAVSGSRTLTITVQ
jgi:hypothetical protein